MVYLFYTIVLFYYFKFSLFSITSELSCDFNVPSKSTSFHTNILSYSYSFSYPRTFYHGYSSAASIRE